jgi:hypothetical protein
VYEALLTSIVNAAETNKIKLHKIERPGTYRSLDRVLHKIRQKNTSTVVLLDEFELLAANDHLTPYFFARLRGLTTKYDLAYLTASQRPLFSITADEKILSSPFFNIFVTLSLGLFTNGEAMTLLQRRMKGTSVDFSEDLYRHLLHLAGPHPCFLHIAGYHAFQALVQGQDLSTSEKLATLDAAIEVEAESHLGYLWQNLSPEERYCLAILDGPIDAVRQLEQQSLITPDANYTSEILRRFVRRQQVEGLIQFGPFVIDRQRRQVQAERHILDLTNSQFNLLVRLARHADEVVTSKDLEIAVWGDALVDDPDRLKTLIKRLRRAIIPYNTWIVSERSVGYALRPPN